MLIAQDNAITIQGGATGMQNTFIKFVGREVKQGDILNTLIWELSADGMRNAMDSS